MVKSITEKKFECFDLSIEDNVAHLILNRPEKMNSMIPDFWTELPEIITTVDEDALARVMVISSNGKHFCSGMDLGVFSTSNITSSEEEVKKNERGRQRGSFYKNLLKLQETFNCIDEATNTCIAKIRCDGWIDTTENKCKSCCR